MNAGVGTSPCAVVRTPARAAPSVAVTRSAAAPCLARSRGPGGRFAEADGRRSGPGRLVRPAPAVRRHGPVHQVGPTVPGSPAPVPGTGAWPSGTRGPVRNVSSQYEHGIAERVEAIVLGDRELVQPPRLLHAGEGHHECEQRRAGQVEVREERVAPPELVAGCDEQTGPTLEQFFI